MPFRSTSSIRRSLFRRRYPRRSRLMGDRMRRRVFRPTYRRPSSGTRQLTGTRKISVISKNYYHNLTPA